MKLKATKADVKKHYHRILSIGYCDAQHLLDYEKPFGYSAGVYGWACDYYDIDGICISTGYSPLATSNMKKDYKIILDYDKKAQDKTKEERRQLLKELLELLTIKDRG